MTTPPPGKWFAFMIAARRVQVTFPGEVSQTPLSSGALAATSATLFTVRVGGADAPDAKTAPISSKNSAPMNTRRLLFRFIKRSQYSRPRLQFILETRDM